MTSDYGRICKCVDSPALLLLNYKIPLLEETENGTPNFLIIHENGMGRMKNYKIFHPVDLGSGYRHFPVIFTRDKCGEYRVDRPVTGNYSKLEVNRTDGMG